jgi:hypothetical protein
VSFLATGRIGRGSVRKLSAQGVSGIEAGGLVAVSADPTGKTVGFQNMKKAFRADHAVPISKAIRAGDFVFTSAYGPWLFDPRNLTFDADGNMLDDGTGLKDMPFDEQVH